MHPLLVFGKLLPSLSTPTKSPPSELHTTLTRSTIRHPHTANNRRRPSLRHHKTGSSKRSRRAPLSPLPHHPQQHRHPPSHSLRQRHHHPRLLRSQSRQALPIPAGLNAQPHLQHVLQHHLLPPLRLLRNRHSAHFQARRTTHRTAAAEYSRRSTQPTLILTLDRQP